MAKGKNEEQLKQTAMNLCKNIGIDFNEALQAFRGNICGFGGPQM